MPNVENDHVVVYQREDGKYDWRRVDNANGKTVTTSGGQGYERRDDALEAAEGYNPGLEVVNE